MSSKNEIINIKLEHKELQSMVDELINKCKDTSKPMAEISNIMLMGITDNFEQQGRPNKWKGLAESTKTARKKRGHWPGAILNESGASGLLGSIQAESGNGYAIAGTNKIYAAIHHFGGNAGRGKTTKIPNRPFMLLQDTELDEIVEVIKRYL